MTEHEQLLLDACESLYTWALLPDRTEMLAAVKAKADRALRLYESPLPGQRLRLEKIAKGERVE